MPTVLPTVLDHQRRMVGAFDLPIVETHISFVLLGGAPADAFNIGAPHHRVSQRQIKRDTDIPAEQHPRQPVQIELRQRSDDQQTDHGGDHQLGVEPGNADRQRGRRRCRARWRWPGGSVMGRMTKGLAS